MSAYTFERPEVSTVKQWRHSRKGTIVGTELPTSTDEWVDIELARDHRLNYASASAQGTIDAKGEVIRVRRSFLTEIWSK